MKPFTHEDLCSEGKDSVHNMALLFNRTIIKDPGVRTIDTVEEMVTPIREVFIKHTPWHENEHAREFRKFFMRLATTDILELFGNEKVLWMGGFGALLYWGTQEHSPNICSRALR